MAIIKTTQQSLEALIGSDLRFPIVNSFEPISGVDLLLQDIQQLLLTTPGERLMRPSFGCNIRNMIWENIDTVSQNGASEIRSAITKFEPRVTVTSVTSSVNRNTGLVIFSIVFLINTTTTSANLLFPIRTSQQLASA